MITVVPELMRAAGKKVKDRASLLPSVGAVEGEYVGAKPADCPGVVPVTRVLERGPEVFVALREELRLLLEETATAFAEAADILEAVDEQASAEVGTLLERVDKATATGGDPASVPGIAAGATVDDSYRPGGLKR